MIFVRKENHIEPFLNIIPLIGYVDYVKLIYVNVDENYLMEKYVISV